MWTACPPTNTKSTQAAAHRREDVACQSDAGSYLRALIGTEPDLVWDDHHHLQGHAHCSGREIILIAARDTDHHALVFTKVDWAAIRRANGPERSRLLQTCAIDSRERLLSALAAT